MSSFSLHSLLILHQLSSLSPLAAVLPASVHHELLFPPAQLYHNVLPAYSYYGQLPLQHSLSWQFQPPSTIRIPERSRWPDVFIQDLLRFQILLDSAGNCFCCLSPNCTEHSAPLCICLTVLNGNIDQMSSFLIPQVCIIIDSSVIDQVTFLNVNSVPGYA